MSRLVVAPDGAVWFSFVDVQNAFWAFELGWFLVPAAFLTMLALLFIPRTQRPWHLVAAALAAVVASVAWIDRKSTRLNSSHRT